MFTVVGIIILVAGLAGIVYALVRYFAAEDHYVSGRQIPRPKFRTDYLIYGVIVFFVGLTIAACTTQVPAGSRGVAVMWGGQVEDRQVSEGLAFKLPFIENIIFVDVRVQAHEFKGIDAASKEMQTVKLTGNVNWKFDPAYVNKIYQGIGASKDFVDKILDKSLQDFLKEVTPRYSITDILPKRSEIRAEAVKVLSESLRRYNIIIDDIYIADIQFSAEYMAAIEKQQVAERQVTTERNILEQFKIQAEQTNTKAVGAANANATTAEGQKRAAITQAEGERQAMMTKAEGEAQAILTVANAQAKANETVNKTLTDQIIRYALTQKLGDDIKVVILPSGQNFILGPEVLGK